MGVVANVIIKSIGNSALTMFVKLNSDNYRANGIFSFVFPQNVKGHKAKWMTKKRFLIII